MKTTYVTNLAGAYGLQLIVSDRVLNIAPITVHISAESVFSHHSRLVPPATSSSADDYSTHLSQNDTQYDSASTRTIRDYSFFFFQAEDGIRDDLVTGVQTCALPISGCPGAGRCERVP